jgi:hypothetical protein
LHACARLSCSHCLRQPQGRKSCRSEQCLPSRLPPQAHRRGAFCST